MSKLVWTNPRGIGRVYVRHGHLWTSVGDRRSSTGIEFPAEASKVEQKKAIAGAMKVLQGRVREHEHPVVVIPTAVPQVSLYDAIADFKDNKFESFSRSIRSRYRMAFDHFLLDEQHGDMLLTFDGLKKRINERKRTCSLSTDTRAKVLYKVTKFLQYCVENDWLTRNPMDVITIEKVEHDDDDLDDNGVTRWELAEMRAMRDWLATQGYARQVEYVEFLELTGARPFEPLNSRVEHWDGSTLRIKGKRTKSNRTGWRTLPLRDADLIEVRPDLISLLERLIANAHHFGGYLFPWRTLSSIQSQFKKCREALGIDDGRSLKTYRPTANWYFREHLQWSREFRCLWLGHSPTVNRLHYETKRTPEEIIRAASRRSRPDAD